MNEIHAMLIICVVSMVAIAAPAIMPKEYPCINGSVYTKHQNTFYKLVDKDNLPLKCGEMK